MTSSKPPNQRPSVGRPLFRVVVQVSALHSSTQQTHELLVTTTTSSLSQTKQLATRQTNQPNHGRRRNSPSRTWYVADYQENESKDDALDQIDCRAEWSVVCFGVIRGNSLWLGPQRDCLLMCRSATMCFIPTLSNLLCFVQSIRMGSLGTQSCRYKGSRYVERKYEGLVCL